LLNVAEITAYAKGEYKFQLAQENLDRIVRQICRGGKGISLANLQHLKTAIGIARDEATQKAKRAERLEQERIEREAREKKEAEINARKSTFSKECQELMAALLELDPKVKEAEKLTEEMVKDANAGKIKEADDARERLTAIEGSVQTTHATIASVQLKGQDLSNKIAEDKEVAELMSVELLAVGKKTEGQDLALRKALASAAQAKQQALARAFALFESLRMEVAAKLRVCIETQGGKPDDLYEAISKAGGHVTKKTIKAYLEANSTSIDDEKLDGVFPTTKNGEAEAEEPTISEEDFMRVVRIFYKVVKEIVLSDNLLIEQSEQLRRMELGEVVEVFQGPMLDPSVGVYRINGRTLKDGVMGWVTVAGNQGITFLMPGGNLFKVIRPARLTDSAEDIEGEQGVRQLSEGEILEVIAWQRVNEGTSSAVTRIKAKVQGENKIGWTSITEGGMANLEVV